MVTTTTASAAAAPAGSINNNAVSKPAATLQPTPCDEADEFDPFSRAKPCSPFYLYNHDSPRASSDLKAKSSVNVSSSVNISLRDLEANSEALTPSVSQEKMNNLSQQTSRVGGWRGRMLPQRCQQHMTKPKEKSWLKRMPKRQRVMVKLLIAFVVVGCMVGIAVGLAVGLQSSVLTSNGQQKTIGKT